MRIPGVPESPTGVLEMFFLFYPLPVSSFLAAYLFSEG